EGRARRPAAAPFRRRGRAARAAFGDTSRWTPARGAAAALLLRHPFVSARVSQKMILSAPFMPQPQPVIDGFEFASAGASLRGALPIRDFPRLHDMLAGHDGEVAYEVEGLQDERGRPALRLKVRTRLELRCQRCLEALPFEVRADEMLVLAGTQAEIDAEPADVYAA